MKQYRNRRSVRRGFTLLELMLAIGLTTLLIAALYSAMSTYWNLAMDSRQDVERSRIARAVLRRMARDIQSCTFLKQTAEEDDEDSDDTTDESLTTTSDELTPSVYGNGLVGTERDLLLYISHPDPELKYVAPPDAVNSMDRSSDLLLVRWLLAERSGSGLASALAEEHGRDHSHSIVGLARASGGLEGFGAAMTQGEINLQAESSELLAAEVEQLVFSYYDGIEWLVEWDSDQQNDMPKAIRIELTLRQPPDDDDNEDSVITDLPPSTHTLVVPLPVASPEVVETTL